MSLLDFLKRGPRKKLCARCGHGAAHGYSISPTLDRDINALLSRIELCSDCKAPANCLWIGSKGISIETFGEVLKRGPSQTLLTWGNSETASQCGKCLSARISKDLRSGNFEFFEICSPHDTQEGLVMPMAY